jgi:hypothetical protein
MSMQPDPYAQPLQPVQPVVDPLPPVDPYGETVVGYTAVSDAPRMVIHQPAAAAVPVATVAAQPAVHRTVATSSGRRLAIDSVVVGLVGLALTIVGLLAITRGGFDGPLDQPVVEVLGFTHTTTLGLIEAGFGICLLLCAAATSRSGAAFFGTVLGIGAVVGAAQTDSFEKPLALESGLAVLVVIASIVVVAVSLLMPRMSTRTARVESF